MEIKRTVTMEVERPEVGDIISFNMDGVTVAALAVKDEGDGMLFVLNECPPEDLPMNEENTNRGGWDACELRKKLNGAILDRFPAELRALMLPFGNGDFLRLPTEKEIFGDNAYCEAEDESVEQWEPMKNRFNRMCLQGAYLAWYWLMNKVKNSAALFACVSSRGGANSDGAGYSLGVRPVFKIKYL